MMGTQDKNLGEISVYADPASRDGVAQFFRSSYKKLEEAGFDIKETRKVIFGVKKWPLKNAFGHRAVILKLPEQSHTAFKLELEIDLPQDDKTYIKGLFNCPDQSCGFDKRSFEELANHHLTNHRKENGDDVVHSCCNKSFQIFEAFSAHQYEEHRSFRCVTPNFEKVIEEKYGKYLAPDQVTFYEQFEKSGTMEQMIEAAGEIILSFGRYWIFMWNCQDFASWFLYTMGIPLRELEPTLPDKLTGSGTSGGKIQFYKSWAWYKQPQQLKKYELSYLGGDVLCKHCDFLPPLSLNAIVCHMEYAHPEHK